MTLTNFSRTALSLSKKLLKGRSFNSPVVAFVASGACLSLITFPYLGVMVLPGLVLFLIGVQRSKSFVSAAGLGLLVGWMKSSGALLWLWYSYPMNWMGVESALAQLLMIGVFWFTCSLSLGAGLIVPALSARYLMQRSATLLILMVLFPLAWLIGELAGSLALSLFVLGPGSYLNAYVTYGYVGLAFGRFTLFDPVSALAGLYGLTAAAALLGSLIYLRLHERVLSNPALLGYGAVLLILNLIYVPTPPTLDGQRVIAVDTDFTISSLRDREGQAAKDRDLIMAVESALELGPDLVLLPEDSRYTFAFGDVSRLQEYLETEHPDSDTVIVDTSRISLTPTRSVLRSFYYDIRNKHVYAVDKQFLVPQGEYVSYFFGAALDILGFDETLATSRSIYNYVPGPAKTLTNDASWLPGTLFCYESVSGVGVMGARKMSASSFVLHPLSHARFQDPRLMWYQLDTMLRVQAIWNQTSIISAGNRSEGKLYGADGSIQTGEVVGEGGRWKLSRYEI